MTGPTEPAPGGASGEGAPRSRAAAAKRALVTALKLALAAGLLGWLFSRGDLDPEGLARPLASPATVVLVVGLAAVALALTGLRWWLLLRGEGIDVSPLTAVHLTWIGHFWNMVIPGAVSGDAVKMYYVGRRVPAEQREESWSTVIADRVIGLAALVTLATIVALARLDLMWGRAPLRATFLGMLVTLLGFLGGGVVVGLGVGRRWRITRAIRDRLPFGESLSRSYAALQRLLRQPGRVTVAFGMSLVSHAASVTNAYLIGRVFADVGPALYFVLVPVGMFSNAVPLTPGGGIGVGESVLSTLFQWAAPPGFDPALLARAGVSVMVWVRLIAFLMAGVGGLLYAFYRRGAEPARPQSAQLTSHGG